MSWLTSTLTSLGTSAFGSWLGNKSAKSNANYNAQLERENWKYMQSNAHQLEIDDLKNAGLNPILSATNSQLASMPAVSGQAVSDNGLGVAFANAASAKELKSLDLENRKLELQVEALSKGIKLDKDGNIVDSSLAEEGISSQNYLNKARAAESSSAAAYNDIKAVNDTRITDISVKKIQQDIDNSISETKALVEKYGAESQAARASAAYSWKQIETETARIAYIISQKENIDLDSAKLIKELQDPDSHIHSAYRGTWIGTVLGYIGEAIKDITPLRFGLSFRGK